MGGEPDDSEHEDRVVMKAFFADGRKGEVMAIQMACGVRQVPERINSGVGGSEWISSLVRAIAEATAKSARRLKAWAYLAVQAIDRKLAHASMVEIKRKQYFDDQYARNFHHLKFLF